MHEHLHLEGTAEYNRGHKAAVGFTPKDAPRLLPPPPPASEPDLFNITGIPSYSGTSELIAEGITRTDLVGQSLWCVTNDGGYMIVNVNEWAAVRIEPVDL